MTTGSRPQSLPTSLLEWIVSVLGEPGRELASSQPLAALTLAGARSSEPLPEVALRDWSQLLRDSQIALDQNRIAFAEGAQRAGLPESVIAAGLFVPSNGINTAISNARERVEAARRASEG